MNKISQRNPVNVQAGREIRVKLLSFIKEMTNDLHEISNNNVDLILEKRHLKIGDCDLVRFISEKTYEDKIQHMFRNVLLSTVYQSQNNSGLAGYISLHCTLTCTKALLQKQGYVDRASNEKWCDDFIKLLSQQTKHAKLETVHHLYNVMSSDTLARDLTKIACEFAGLTGQITFNTNCETNTHINVLNGAHFKCVPIPEFWHIKQVADWQQQHVIVIVIDGIIETVGEIHKILQYLNENKKAAVFFARGYSEEVIATLGVNAQRKTLDVVPVVVPYTPTHINTLNDIATVCGCDVISSLKGELISSITIDEYEPVDMVKINSQNSVIINSKTKSQVDFHITHLTQQNLSAAEEEKLPSAILEKTKLIQARIQALTGRCVIIAIGPGEHMKGIIMDHIKAMLSITRYIPHHGILKCNDIFDVLEKMPRSDYKSALHKSFSNIHKKYKHIPFYDIMVGIKNGTQCAQQIKEIGAAVVFK